MWLRLVSISILSLTVLVSGCAGNLLSSASQIFEKKLELRRVTLVTSEDVNNGFPVAVEIVFLHDAALIQSIESIKSTQWFANKDDYRSRERSKVSVLRFELVPGQEKIITDFPDRYRSAKKVFIFASYTNGGDYRLSVNDRKSITVIFENDKIAVVDE